MIATAGHVDHGKSALLRALTGMEPDRWAEERRRGMTIDLGYAWLALPSGETLAFVDVPGHARFVSNMLAGVGPVPAVLFVVAADAGWMPQSAEHLAAVDALGITRGLLAVTRSDLADPGPATRQALARIRESSLGEVPAVAVSAVSGAGLDRLVAALAELAGSLPVPDPDGPVRIWIDRAFTMTGSGTVVTGTLPAGAVSRGDELVLTPAQVPVRVRGLQSLGAPAQRLTGVARVAINLRGAERAEVGRGMALVQPGRWTLTSVLDVRLVTGRADGQIRLPRAVTVHVGSARTPATIRQLGAGVARLTLRDPAPLHVGDRLLVRDPGAARDPDQVRPGEHPGPDGPPDEPGWPGLVGAVVLDVAPPRLSRRGAAASAAAELRTWADHPTVAQLTRRHGLIGVAALRAMGADGAADPVADGWIADPEHWAELRSRLSALVAEHRAAEPLAPGLPLDVARKALGLPDRKLVGALAKGLPELDVAGGLVTPAGADPGSAGLPAPVARAVRALAADLAASPFRAPDSDRLAQLGLDRRTIAVAARHGAVLRLGESVVLGPDADRRAAQVLAGLPQPFTTAEARIALDSTRRTVIPLLEHLDRQRVTRRLPDDRRELRNRDLSDRDLSDRDLS